MGAALLVVSIDGQSLHNDRMIPWVAILKHAPAILAAADSLRSRVLKNDAGDSARGVDARLAELEGESRAAAQMAQ